LRYPGKIRILYFVNKIHQTDSRGNDKNMFGQIVTCIAIFVAVC
jgi:hypothetical protein